MIICKRLSFGCRPIIYWNFSMTIFKENLIDLGFNLPKPIYSDEVNDR